MSTRSITTTVGSALLGAILLFSLVLITSSSQALDKVYSDLSRIAGQSQLAALGSASTPILVQSKGLDAGSVQKTSITFNNSTSAGNLIVVALRKAAPQTCSLADNRGNSYGLITTIDQPEDHRDHLWYAKNIYGGATTITVTCPQVGTTRLAIHEFSGIDTGSPLDRISTNIDASGTSATASTGSMSPSQANELVFGFCSVGNSSSFNPSSGYSLAQTVGDKIGTLYKTISSTGIQNPGFSISPADVSVCIGATFKAAASTVASPADTVAPSISSVQVSSVTTSSATISWNTNEAATTQVEYGVTTAYGSNTSEATSLTTPHSVTISGLSSNTVYNFRVKSRDSSSNLAISGNFNFTTTSSVVQSVSTPVVVTQPSTITPIVQANPIFTAASEGGGSALKITDFLNMDGGTVGGVVDYLTARATSLGSSGTWVNGPYYSGSNPHELKSASIPVRPLHGPIQIGSGAPISDTNTNRGFVQKVTNATRNEYIDYTFSNPRPLKASVGMYIYFSGNGDGWNGTLSHYYDVLGLTGNGGDNYQVLSVQLRGGNDGTPLVFTNHTNIAPCNSGLEMFQGKVNQWYWVTASYDYSGTNQRASMEVYDANTWQRMGGNSCDLGSKPLDSRPLNRISVGRYDNHGYPTLNSDYYVDDLMIDATGTTFPLLPGAGSVVSNDTTPPSTPINLNATGVSSTEVSLSWTASTDASGIAGYNIYRATGTGLSTLLTSTTGTATTYLNTGLTANTSYTYRIAARDASSNGNVSQLSIADTVTTNAVSTVGAINCDITTLQTAVTSARAGDTITCNPGSWTWNNTLSINKGVILKGAVNNGTVINSNTSGYLIAYDPSNYTANTPFRVSGFVFDFNGSSGGGIDLGRSRSDPPFTLQTQVRIDHNTFRNQKNWGGNGVIRDLNVMRGVVDNNIFDQNTYIVRVANPVSGGAWWNYAADAAFHKLDFGQQNNSMYYEDNTINKVVDTAGTEHPVAGCQYSGRYIFRYNTITVTSDQYPLFDLHGNATAGGSDYSCFGTEMYGNKIINNNSDIRLVDQRGGRAMIFGNEVQTPSANINVRSEFSDSTNPVTTINPLTGRAYVQHVTESYYWNNKAGGSAMSVSEGSGNYNDQITPNVDYFSDTNASGVRIGTRAQRPATCTAGAGYWETNDSNPTSLSGKTGAGVGTSAPTGSLYRCASNGTWPSTPFYTPLAYPHPLRVNCTLYPTLCDAGSTVVDITPPAVSVAVSNNSVQAGVPITLSATASDTSGIAGVQFKRGTVNVGTEDTTAPYSIDWDTTGVTAGAHIINAIARDNAGLTTTSAGVGVTLTPVGSLSCENTDLTNLNFHINNQINSRLTLSSPSTGLNIYTSRPATAGASWTRNSNSWTQKGTSLDFTGVMGWNNDAPTHGDAYRGGATLITPRHFISAQHFLINPGSNVYFFDKDGRSVVRRVVATRNITGTDINVGLLDSDVDSSIKYYPLMSYSNVENYFLRDSTRLPYNVPIVTFNKEGQALVRKMSDDGPVNVSHRSYNSSADSLKAQYSADIVDGDSGQPGFVIINNTPILLFAHQTADQGPSLGNNLSAINAAIVALGSSNGYTVTEYTPSGFTRYANTCTLPTATSGAVKIKLVGTDLVTGSAPASVASKIDSSAASVSNPNDVTGLVVASPHTVYGTDIAGHIETVAMCTYPIGGTECTLAAPSSYTTTGLTCAAGFCGIPVAVSVNTVTKVVFKYDAVVTQGPTLIPADRVVQWQGAVGVEGEIPARATVRNCVTSDAVPVDGITDATASIRACLTNTPSDTAAYLPSGTYTVSGTITVPANKTLRGEGTSTILKNTNAALNTILYIGAGRASSTLLPIESGYTKDSNQITLRNASSISVGNYLLINELNDPTLPVTKDSYAEPAGCTWCDQFGATRLRAQVVKVTGKSGNTLTLESPLFNTFSASRSPSAMKLNNLVEFAGIENLTVSNEGTTKTGNRNNILIEGAANSWVKNVKVDNCGERCIDLRTYFYRIEIRDNLITRCINHVDSDNCYGTEVAEGSNSLIENNIYNDTSNGPLLMWGASGNVVAYNYIYGVYREDDQSSWMWPNTWSHGAHPSYNLWEGNFGSGLNWDGYWGSASHNTAFRNRFTSKDELQGLGGGHVEAAAIIVENNNTYSSIIGNVLGLAGWSNKYEEKGTRYWSSNLIYAVSTPGPDTKPFTSMFRHRNFDYATNSTKNCGDAGEPGCQGSNAATTLPASLYLASKPAWFGTVSWPAIGPDVSGMYAKIPAQVCFERGEMPNCLAGGAITNSAPVLAAIGAKSVTANSPLSFTVTASDANSGDTLTYSISTLSGASINASTGAFTWTPTTAQVGNHSVTFTVSDGKGGTDTETITITVNAIVVPTGDLLIKLVGSDLVTRTAPNGVQSRVDAGSLVATNPVTVAGVSTGAHTVSFTDSPTYTESYATCTFPRGGAECSLAEDAQYVSTGMTCAAGLCSVSATVNAATVTKVVPRYVLTVIPNRPPTVSVGNDLTITLPATAALSATASDPDGTTLTYSWSKVSGPGTVTFSTGSAVTTTATFSTQGSYVLNLTVSDGALSASDMVTVSVNPVVVTNAAPVLGPIGSKTVIENSLLTFTVAATDADRADRVTYSATGLPTGATFNQTTGVFSWTPTKSDVGARSITFTASDGNGATDAETVSITVQAAPIVSRVLTVQKIGTGQGTVASSPAGINCGTACPSETFSFEEGTQVTLSASAAPGSRFVGWTGGCVSTSVTCITTLAAATTATVNFELLPVNKVPVLNTIGAKSGTETNLLSFTISATDGDQNDTLRYSATNLPVGAELNSTTGAFTWTPNYIQSGSHSVTFSVSDGNGGTDSEVVTITISNTNQIATVDAGNDQRISLPRGVTLRGSGTDLDGTPLSYTWTQVSGPIAAVFSSKTIENPTVTFNNRQGTYVFRLTITEDTNATASDEVTVVVTAAIVDTGTDGDADGVKDNADQCPDTPRSLEKRINTVGCPVPLVKNGVTITDLANVDLDQVESFELSSASGKIAFMKTGEAYALTKNNGTEQLDLDTTLNIAAGKVSLDSDRVPALKNRPALITLYNITVDEPVILRDGVRCSTCTLVSYSNNTLIFMVPGFSEYTVIENPPVVPPVVAVNTPSATPSQSTGGGNISGSKPRDTQTPVVTVMIPAFTRNLSVGLSGEDVQNLQTFLNTRGYAVSTTGPGSRGQESIFFGPATEAALKRFQCAEGITCTGTAATTGYGSFGPRTRTLINSKVSGATVPRTPSGLPSTPVTTPNAPITGVSTPIPEFSTAGFTRDLTLESEGEDVRQLQMYLNSQGFVIATTGTGSKGNESTYFGNLTQAALARFQAAKNITPAEGYFGRVTRAYIRAGE
jgi:hypothetical protein